MLIVLVCGGTKSARVNLSRVSERRDPRHRQGHRPPRQIYLPALVERRWHGARSHRSDCARVRSPRRSPPARPPCTSAPGYGCRQPNTAYLRRAFGWVTACRFHKGVEPEHVLIYEGAIEAASLPAPQQSPTPAPHPFQDGPADAGVPVRDLDARGSITTSLAPLRLAALIWRIRCRLQTVALFPRR